MRASFQLMIFISCAASFFTSVTSRAGLEIDGANESISYSLDIPINPEEPSDVLHHEVTQFTVDRNNFDSFMNEVSKYEDRFNEIEVEFYEGVNNGPARYPSRLGIFQTLKDYFKSKKTKSIAEIDVNLDEHQGLFKKLKREAKWMADAYTEPLAETKFTALVTFTYRGTIVTLKMMFIKGLTPLHSFLVGLVSASSSWGQARWGSSFLDKLFSGNYRPKDVPRFPVIVQNLLRMAVDVVIIELLRFVQSGGDVERLLSAAEQLDIGISALLLNRLSAKILTQRLLNWPTQEKIRSRVALFFFGGLAPLSILQQLGIGPEVVNLGFYVLKAPTIAVILANWALYKTLRSERGKTYFENLAIKHEKFFLKGAEMTTKFEKKVALTCEHLFKGRRDLKEETEAKAAKAPEELENLQKTLQKGRDDFTIPPNPGP